MIIHQIAFSSIFIYFKLYQLANYVFLPFYQLFISSAYHFIDSSFNRLIYSSTYHFINSPKYQFTISSTYILINLSFHQFTISSTYNFINTFTNTSFHQHIFSSTYILISLTFHNLSFHQCFITRSCHNLPLHQLDNYSTAISSTGWINNFPYHQIVISSTQRYANLIKIEFLSSAKRECLDYVLYLVANHVKYFSKMSFTKWHVDKMTERQQFFRRFI